MPKAGGEENLRTLMLFPAPSELATALKVGGVQVKAIPQLESQIPAPAWSKLTTLEKALQLGSVIGYLGVSTVSGNMPAVTRCLAQLLDGAHAMGIDPKSPSLAALAQLRDRAKEGQISDAQILAGLDESRRKVLREVSGKVEEKEFSFVLAAAWLRGSALLASQVKTDVEAAKVGEFVMRPELLAFVKQIPPTTKVANPARAASAEHLLAVAKKSNGKDAAASKSPIRQSDLAEFVSYANAVLK